MRYRHRVPRPPLDSFVESIWVYQNDPRAQALERILPTGAAQLIVNLKEDQTRLYDPDAPLRYVATSGSVLPPACNPAFRSSIRQNRSMWLASPSNREGRCPSCACPRTKPAMPTSRSSRSGATVVPPLSGNGFLKAAVSTQTLDALEAVLQEMWRPPGLHPAVAYALAAFDRAPRTTSIGAVTDAIGLSAKRFIERFTIQVGLTPKRYCRIRRFQRAVTMANGGCRVGWTRVALDCGYFDQAHFIHDFRSFAGLTPTDYQSARTSFQNHVKFLQSSAGDV